VVWWLLRRRNADPQVRLALTVTCLLIAVQGLVGGIQYALELPAEIVWLHVVLAASTWICLLWATAAAGRIAPATAAAPEPAKAMAAR